MPGTRRRSRWGRRVTGPATVARPATSKKLRANVTRGVITAADRSWRGTPRGGRRRPRQRRRGGAAPRSAPTNGGGQGTVRHRVGGRRRRLGAVGNSVSPVSGARRVSTSRRRASRVAAMRWRPRSSAGWPEPAGRLDLLEPGPRRLGELVGVATRRTTSRRRGRATSPRCASSSRIECVLRPMRRPSSPAAAPSRGSWGSTVIASAPAIPAAKQATVERSAFTHGSYAVIIARDVTAWTGDVASGAPTCSATRAHSRRTARNVAIVAN